jgi:UDP-4-amino-4,6-dideoxy-N-acetyl-beta-L-altrosamine transaminase
VTYSTLDEGRLSEERFLPYGTQWLDEQDIQAVLEVLRGDWLTQGPKVREFEARVAERCGARYGVAVATGTAALHCAAFAAGIGAGDEVITSALTFVASANCILYLGGRPVFADIDPVTLTCDPGEVAQRVTQRTKALIPVDFAGHPADMDELMEVARHHGLTVIADAAHSIGATYRGRLVGTLADMTVLSFHPVKHITTGEGGMVLTDDVGFYERLMLFRTHGITNRTELLTGPSEGGWYYEMQALGFNYRITDLQCALGLSQLARLDAFVARRREIADCYTRSFVDVPEIITPQERPYVRSSYHLYVLQFDFSRLHITRAELFAALRKKKLGVQVHYIPVHLQPFYRDRFDCRRGDFPKAEAYYDRCLTIPLYPRMSDADVHRVVGAVREVVEAARLG